MVYYAVCALLSAFLLFQIEPMIGRFLLPAYGGTPAVWSTALMFFQILLTGGYAYAFWLIRLAPDRKRTGIHIALLAASVIVMLVLGFIWKTPIFPGSGWQPAFTANPIWEICKVLGMSVSLPFFLLASNSTLVQAWYLRSKLHRAPYFLYALSNLGSIAGLLAYLWIVEPGLTLREQGLAWSAGYLVFTLLAGYGAYRSFKTRPALPEGSTKTAISHPGIGARVMWVALSACTSILLLATTSQLTQDVAAIPFLWVLPLTLYLLSFFIAFSSERWYARQVFLFVFIGVTILFGRALALGPVLDVISQILYLSLGLFTACLVLHAELYRRRPHANELSSYYLYIVIGGSAGAICVSLIAPSIFKGYWELPIGFALSWVLYTLVHGFDKVRARGAWLRMINLTLLLYGVGFTAMLAYQSIRADLSDSILIERNFYGVLRVKEAQIGSPGVDVIQLTHGVTIHGAQFVSAQLRDQPTTYYTEHSGVGMAIRYHPHRDRRLRVGVLGLGIGTLAAYGQPGDTFRFYEINPQVVELATGAGGYFTFLKDSPSTVEIVPGDARRSLELELADGTRQDFDLLVLDTFNSDAIPVHLINQQAFEIYLQRLKPDGILAAHVSNLHFDFVPVVWKLAQYFHLHMLLIQNTPDDLGGLPPTWILLSRQAASLENPQIEHYSTNLDGYTPNIRLWTDDYSNLLQILR